MPAPVQRRVRSGCLTCRGRRRKCDEAKPICNNCQSKDLVCRYGVNISFVPQKRHDSQRAQRSRLPRRAGLQTGHDDNTIDSVPEPSRHQSRVNSLIETAHEQLIGRVETSVNQDHNTIPQQQGTTIFQYEQNFAINHLPNSDSASQIGPERNLAIWPLPPQQRSPHNWSRSNQQSGPVGEARGVTNPPGLEIIDEAQDQYELELLSYYRYKVAPVLDLGVGGLYYGVQALVNSAHCRRLYLAILAVASCHRAAVGSQCSDFDQVTSGSCASDADENRESASLEDRVTSMILLLWRNCLMSPPGKWLEVLQDVILPASNEDLRDEHRQLLARLLLAATLMAPTHMGHVGRLWMLDDLLQTSTGPPPAGVFAQHQLHQALQSLDKSLRFLPGIAHSRYPTEVPLVPAWQSCWRDSQSWFSRRSDEMHEIFAANDSTLHRSQSSNRPIFPIIVLSNAYATVANIVHHLTAMLLLQHKPRLVKAVPDSHSSISPIWHAQRIFGIATAATEPDVWDPIVVAAVSQAAKRLSHSTQISAVAEILRKACKGSGMRVEADFDSPDQASARTG